MTHQYTPERRDRDMLDSAAHDLTTAVTMLRQKRGYVDDETVDTFFKETIAVLEEIIRDDLQFARDAIAPVDSGWDDKPTPRGHSALAAMQAADQENPYIVAMQRRD